MNDTQIIKAPTQPIVIEKGDTKAILIRKLVERKIPRSIRLDGTGFNFMDSEFYFEKEKKDLLIRSINYYNVHGHLDFWTNPRLKFRWHLSDIALQCGIPYHNNYGKATDNMKGYLKELEDLVNKNFLEIMLKGNLATQEDMDKVEKFTRDYFISKVNQQII